MTPRRTALLTTEDVERSETSDGSVTIKRKDTGWMYRSAQGARQESHHVFVLGALGMQNKKEFRIFELGFGMGMNFEATMDYAHENGLRIHYESVDHLPVPPEFAHHPTAKQALEEARRTGDTCRIECANGTLILHPKTYHDTKPEGEYDAIYHDPFGPGANPECWTEDCFRWQFPLLKNSGIWTSYGAAGNIRRALASAGFFVAVGEGIGKKRETTRAAKQEALLEGYKIKYRPTKL